MLVKFKASQLNSCIWLRNLMGFFRNNFQFKYRDIFPWLSFESFSLYSLHNHKQSTQNFQGILHYYRFCYFNIWFVYNSLLREKVKYKMIMMLIIIIILITKPLWSIQKDLQKGIHTKERLKQQEFPEIKRNSKKFPEWRV